MDIKVNEYQTKAINNGYPPSLFEHAVFRYCLELDARNMDYVLYLIGLVAKNQLSAIQATIMIEVLVGLDFINTFSK